jgi:hypothetical protein
MHANGNWMNDDQRGSHPEPFVFLDQNHRPFKAMMWGDEWWLFYWHDAQKSWVSLRKASGPELYQMRKLELPKDQAKLYDDLHAKSQGASHAASGSQATQ